MRQHSRRASSNGKVFFYPGKYKHAGLGLAVASKLATKCLLKPFNSTKATCSIVSEPCSNTQVGDIHYTKGIEFVQCP